MGKTFESSNYTRLDFLGGVELMTASFVTQNFSRHCHERYAVGCIVDGAMGFRYFGSNLVAAKGQVNTVVPGEFHDGHAAMETGWKYRMFYLRPEALKEASTAFCPAPVLPHFKNGVIDDPALALCVRRTHLLLESDIPDLEKETRLLWLLAMWIRRHGESPGPMAKMPALSRGVELARQFLDSCPDRDLKLAELANLAAMSPFHFIRVFEKQVGVTPHAYLVQARVKKARNLLKDGLRLADIAQLAGFSDQSHLTRAFKRLYGTTPARYRKIIQNR